MRFMFFFWIWKSIVSECESEKKKCIIFFAVLFFVCLFFIIIIIIYVNISKWKLVSYNKNMLSVDLGMAYYESALNQNCFIFLILNW